MSDEKTRSGAPADGSIEQVFDAFLRDEANSVSAAYRKLGTPEPSAQLDARVRAIAAAATPPAMSATASASNPGAIRRRAPRWVPTLASAALLVIAAGVAWRMGPQGWTERDQMKVARETAPTPASDSAATAPAPAAAPAPAPATPVSQPESAPGQSATSAMAGSIAALAEKPAAAKSASTPDAYRNESARTQSASDARRKQDVLDQVRQERSARAKGELAQLQDRAANGGDQTPARGGTDAQQRADASAFPRLASPAPAPPSTAAPTAGTAASRASAPPTDSPPTTTVSSASPTSVQPEPQADTTTAMTPAEAPSLPTPAPPAAADKSQELETIVMTPPPARDTAASAAAMAKRRTVTPPPAMSAPPAPAMAAAPPPPPPAMSAPPPPAMAAAPPPPPVEATATAPAAQASVRPPPPPPPPPVAETAQATLTTRDNAVADGAIASGLAEHLATPVSPATWPAPDCHATAAGAWRYPPEVPPTAALREATVNWWLERDRASARRAYADFHACFPADTWPPALLERLRTP